MLMRVLAALSLLGSVAACGDAEGGAEQPKEMLNVPDAGEEADAAPEVRERDFPDVTERGKYNVGYRNISVSYSPAGQQEVRHIGAGVWYPTRDADGTHANYLVPRDDVFVGASLLDEVDLPVAIFSHGSGGYAEQSFFWTEFLASHGFVVAAPTHAGNTYAASTIPFSTLPNRPQDVSATLDALYADDDFGPRIGEDVIVAGHSFGGYTSFAVVGAAYDLDLMRANCRRVPSLDFCDDLTDDAVARFEQGFRDERFKLAIPMAPFGAYLIYGDGAAAVDVPVLMFTGSVDASLPNWAEGDNYWESLDGPDDRRVDIVGAGHFTFSNVCELPINIGSRDGCGATNIDPAAAYEVINAYSLAFIRHHLWGDDTNLDLLQGRRSLLDEANFSMP
jgi:predicted dienelactone hydrolase